MAEPIATAGATAAAASLTGSLIILAGPVLGPWLAVLLTAIIGSMWTLSRVDTATRLMAALLSIRIVLTALVLTGIVAALVADYTKPYLPQEHLLPAVSFAISALGDKLQQFKDSAVARLQGVVRGGASQ